MLVVALACGAAAAATSASHDDTVGSIEPDDGTAAPTVVAPTRTVLLTHQDASKRVDLLVLGSSGGTKPGSVLLLPAPTVTDVPSYDRQQLGALVRLGGTPLLRTVVANLTGVRLDTHVHTGDASLARLIGVVPRIRVDLAVPVEVDDGAVAAPAGPSTVTASQAVRLLVGRDPAGALAHQATVQAVLDGWCAALRTNGVARVAAARLPGGSAIVAVCTSTKSLTTETLPVDDVDNGASERFEVRASELEALVRERFVGAMFLNGRPRPRVELLNGVGSVGLASRAAEILVPAGAHVTLTDNLARFGQPTTEILYYRDAAAPEARRLRQVLGLGTVGRSATPLDVVDVTIVLGADFDRAHPGSTP